MPDNRATTASGSSKKRDKKSKAKGHEKQSSTSSSTTTSNTAVKSNTEIKNSSKNKQAQERNAQEQNNNVNKSPKLNLNISKIEHETGDEIIESKVTGSSVGVGVDVGELNAVVAAAAAASYAPDSAQTTNEEFDFDDTDLQELNDNSKTGVNNNDVEVVIGGDVIETTCQPLNQNDNAKHQNETNTAYTLSTNNNNNNESTTAICDNIVKKQSSNEPNTTIDELRSNADENFNVMPNKRKATPPPALDLKETADVVENVAQETYCPITPRRIVDIEELEDDEAPNRVLRSSSSKAIINSKMNNNNESLSASKTNAASLGTAEHLKTGDLTKNGAGDAHADDDDDDDYYDDEDDEPDNELLVQFLGEANRIAEARLAARRQARAEAREIRMRELERQQKEQEQNADRVFDMHTASGIDPLSRSRLTAGLNSASPVGGLLNSARGNSMSSRRSSEDSLEEEGRSLRDIRHELRDVEERFRKAMIANAQLDNERASATYQIQLLKDKLEEMEELHSQLQREFKEKSRDFNALKRNLDKLSEELKLVQGQLNERDTLIAEQGLVIVTVENEDGSDAKRALVSCENAHLLGSVQGSLDVRLKKFYEEKQQLLTEVQQLQEQLENHKSQGKGRGNSMNGPTSGDEEYEAQREANKIITEYKYKLQKAEQEIANLHASLQRSETQVIRYKSTAEAAEKAEAELKIERRKLQRENREAMERLEELETSNNHLLKRLDKLKNAKSALLKDL